MEQEELDKQLLDTQPEHLPEVPSEVPVAAPRPGRSTYISRYIKSIPFIVNEVIVNTRL
jgi:hypothetical protein